VTEPDRPSGFRTSIPRRGPSNPLDREEDPIVDPPEIDLRCPTHGSGFDPVIGNSLSQLCRDERFSAVRVSEENGAHRVKDRPGSARPVEVSTGDAKPPVPARDGSLLKDFRVETGLTIKPDNPSRVRK
jgi:hypothetical protein